MLQNLAFILWNVKPQIFQLGSFEVRWYGLLFAMGFFIGQHILVKWYKSEGKSEKDVERITLYVVIATVIGARLGHCLFYEPAYYLSNPLEILKVWKGGLASHGAAIGILTGIYLYVRNTPGQTYFYVLDRLVILVAIGGGFIRLGNMMNSEIIGKEADLPWSFVYTYASEDRLKANFPGIIEKIEFRKDRKGSIENGKAPMLMKISLYEPVDSIATRAFVESQVLSTVEADPELNKFLNIPEKPKFIAGAPGVGAVNILGVPRHPTQLYESFSYFLIAFLLYFFIYRREKDFPEGKIFAWFLILLFGIRFFHEFLKENQVGFEEGIAFNMGQLLSVPLVLTGIYLLIYKVRPAEKNKT